MALHIQLLTLCKYTVTSAVTSFLEMITVSYYISCTGIGSLNKSSAACYSIMSQLQYALIIVSYRISCTGYFFLKQKWCCVKFLKIKISICSIILGLVTGFFDWLKQYVKK